jgi:tripartite-type tricarboxylate transporter receptor subunit TctC
MKSRLFKTLGIMIAFSVVLAVTAVSVLAAADTYPSKPVRLIVPFPPGGSSDSVGRVVAHELSVRLGKQVIVDNRSGGGGIVGTEVAAKADTDGYTLLLGAGSHTINPALRKLPFDPMKSFTPITRLVTEPNVLAVHPKVPANSVKELIRLARQKPGQLTCAAAGVGSFAHLAAELLKANAGIEFKIVQFKGGGPSLIDLLGGHSDFTNSSAILVLPHAQKLRFLGTSGLKRSVLLPDVPSIAEAGVPGYEATNWYGILAPAGTPAPIVDRLDKELKAMLTSDEVKKWFNNQGAEVGYMGPIDFGPFIAEMINKWAKVVKDANIKVE